MTKLMMCYIFQKEFESSLKKRFSLSLLGQAKWYLGMRIKQEKDYITVDQDILRTL